ncbi:glucose dehydrogenase [FAD, quinone]-like [Episyrphus balteatus]|uniref:glucose dehydrogenase [FAD, quinone]-like n=1 Tax=Episyrphus balteatus TaxID=286459 RepID=UPI002486288A|nr:glucose dehydrogenase [FAD, quinone]-like [Episyrphus balteatus]
MWNIKEFRISFVLVTVLLFASSGKALLPDLLLKGLTFGLDASDFVSEELLPADVPPQNGTYDFIIVGSGPAGCVLANRLSANPNWTVYLLEAGGRENIAHDIPAMASILPLTDSNWGYESVPQKNACKGMYNNVCALPRGKVLSGTSAINFMISHRGNHEDYNRWEKAGNKGWKYEDILPLFKRIEKANLKRYEDSPYHNTTGPLSTEDVAYRTDILEHYIKGSQQAGYKLNDYNGETQMGTSYVQATTLNGHRHTAAKAYLKPIMEDRKNLHILTKAFVTKILIDKKTESAYGVEFTYKNKNITIRAKKEVILSAGAFNSPKLLMLSGIGPKDELERLDIPLIKDLQVGKRMYDHMSYLGPVVKVKNVKKKPTLFTTRLNPLDYLKFKAGDPSTRFSTIGGVEAMTFAKTSNSKQPDSVPDIELILVPTSLAGDFGTALRISANIRKDIYTKQFKVLENKEHFAFLTMCFHPESFGNITLKDKNPKSPPIIDPNYFEKEVDVECILEGVKEAIRITKTPAMQEINATLHTLPTPGCEHIDFGSDDYWRCSIRHLSYTLHHQVATCKMGPESDPTAVVNSLLKVYGLRKLRVADTSIIPRPHTAHTNLVSFLIGEKASDMIIDEWSGR